MREAILAQARKEGFDQAPDIRHAIEELIISAYREKHFATNDSAVSEAQIREYFDGHLAEFTRPKAIRIGVIQLDKESGSSEQVIQSITKADEDEFKRLAARSSEDQATRYRGGDVGWISETDAHPRWPSPVMDAAWSLREVGLVSSPVTHGDSVYLVRLYATESAHTNSLDSVSEVIRHQLARARKSEMLAAFKEALTNSADVEIYESRLRQSFHLERPPPHSPPSTPGH